MIVKELLTDSEIKENKEKANELLISERQKSRELFMIIGNLEDIENTEIGKTLEHLIHKDDGNHEILTNECFIKRLKSDREECLDNIGKLVEVCKKGYWESD